MSELARAAHRGAGVLSLLAVLICACVPISYQPRITLGLSPQTIPLRIEVRDLDDVSVPVSRGLLMGTSATASDSIAGSVPTMVTDAILLNFLNDVLFREARRRLPDADLVMRGTLRRFYGRSGIPAPLLLTFVIPFLPLLGVPVYRSDAAVELELRFELPDGQPVASYQAAQTFSSWDSIYHQPLFGIGTELNRILSAALGDVREQILADRERLVAATAR